MFRGTAGGSPDRPAVAGNERGPQRGRRRHRVGQCHRRLAPRSSAHRLPGCLASASPNKGDITLVNSMGNCMVPPSLDWAKRQGGPRSSSSPWTFARLEEEAIGSGDMYGSVLPGSARYRAPCDQLHRRHARLQGLRQRSDLRNQPSAEFLHEGEFRGLQGPGLLAKSGAPRRTCRGLAYVCEPDGHGPVRNTARRCPPRSTHYLSR